MKTKAIITAVLLLFVAASVGYLILTETRDVKTPSGTPESAPESAPATAAPDSAADSTAHQLLAYYFHGKTRCWTCRTIEAYAEEAIRTGFPEAWDNGRIAWLVVNVEQPENEHFVRDYQLTTRSVVLVDVTGGTERRWIRLDRVWQLVHDKQAFTDYVQGEADSILGGIDG
jgi:hypothetical protein